MLLASHLLLATPTVVQAAMVNGRTPAPWVGATPNASAEVHLRCEFAVPELAMKAAPDEESSRHCHRSSCTMDHVWPNGVLGQFVLRLLKGYCLPAPGEDDGSGEDAPQVSPHEWYAQALYSWKTPTGTLQGWAGSPVIVRPGQKLQARVLPGVDIDAVHSYFVQASTVSSSEPTVLSVITPFVGTREDCTLPKNAGDNHLRLLNFKLSGKHQVWCMGTPLDGSPAGSEPHLDEDAANACADHLAEGRMGCEKDLLITSVQPPLESIRERSPAIVLS